MKKNPSDDDQILIPSKNGYISIPAKGLRAQTTNGPSKPEASQRLLMMKLKNHLQFFLMLVGMLGIMSLIGYTIGGLTGAIAALIAAGIGFLFTANLSITKILRKRNVRPIYPNESTVLYLMIEKLIRKANIDKIPVLFLDNSPEINAYTLEDRKKAAIVLSRGLINNLTKQELFGVLAHEVAHLKNNDIRIMLFSDQLRRLTSYLSFFGQILFLISLPFLLLNQIIVPWLSIFLLILAPTFSFLFQVAVSRNREFRADMDAALLAGDTKGLSSALTKISVQSSIWKEFYAPYLKTIPEVLRTHPNTKTRISRLQL